MIASTAGVDMKALWIKMKGPVAPTAVLSLPVSASTKSLGNELPKSLGNEVPATPKSSQAGISGIKDGKNEKDGKNVNFDMATSETKPSTRKMRWRRVVQELLHSEETYVQGDCQ